ncbi:uncharacterized protein LOC130897807 [Diorhabda carinulata]|uniref:uncharacterized protein LOC130897807 n=1 Tax=Diorhabda carinulata TaxID=1163345 RepID=UPI0024E0A292|nr:uncharacterized protein LOC130448859 isoform X2 [Diorhabda sublineata]XP_056642386.1 uncharacterized protein LOC130448859 isoform X2 [Diorhabda sublineata]XP_057662702.1 uncharacterized protein LOC130897807 [Diorhabda carinulata]XP_057662703.1 uncharacterized protein LOC130897807 [Diorhabda carinulata]XP_057662704.1 uncharacterized protein LOC130897807 [Diorhabda carinulata]
MQCNSVVAAVSVSLLGLFVCFTYAWKEGELNDPCTVVGECRHWAYLCSRNRTCQCISPYYRPNKYWDKCVGIIGQKCQYDEHCIDGAYCKQQQICECKTHLVPNEDNTECSHSSRSSATKYTILPVIVLVYLKLYLCIG